MREVEFRGKRLDNGEWVYGDLWQCKYADRRNEITISEQTPNALCNIKVIPETVGQYIGLKDKNGKKIYEGDIVERKGIVSRERFEVKKDYIEINTPQLGNIIILSFILYDKKAGYKELFAIERTTGVDKSIIEYEVISNIYQDKHLLKEEIN